jgi:hypothetical protein
MSKIIYRVESPARFTNFLKKFSSIESTLLVEIENGVIKAKTHTPDRAVVKSSSIEISEILSVSEGDASTNVMFGLYNIEKFANAFKHFASEFDLIIEFSELDGKNVGTQLTLKNKKLNVRFECASYRIFTHISDDMMERIAGDVDNGVEFELDKNIQSQISSLSGIDSDHKLLTFRTGGTTISAIGKSFDLELTEADEKLDNSNVTIYKQHFNVLDREDSKVVLSEDKIVFRSAETDTVMVVGKTEE